MAAAEPADLVGQKIDDYDIISRLGGGGMGVVYEGKTDQGTRVAIKTLKPAFANDKELVGRFLGEARALKAISHRAMVHILSIGQLDDGTHYMVMEFLEGRSFEEVIEHGAPLDLREVLTWMIEVLDALETVHAAGVIHRDLKPSNLFLARTGVGPQVKLIDFGIAKHTGASGQGAPKTLVSAIVGTPDYMSPEQVNGLEVTAQSDLYALGCVMFEMLSGKLPFNEESSVKKMLMHVERPAPRLSTVLGSIPRPIDDLIASMMSKEPADRPHSARVLKERIQRIMKDELGGGAGPAATMQVRALKPYTEAVTEPSIPVPYERPGASRVRRSRTEPVPKPKRVEVPVWALGAGLAALALGIMLVAFRLARPQDPGPPLPPTVTEGEPPAEVAPPPPTSSVAQAEVKAPPDRPVPKRKKPAIPTRKKPAGGKRR